MTVVVGHIKDGVFAEIAAKEPAVQGTVRHKTDAELAAGLKYAVGLDLTMHQMVFALNSRKRTDCMRLADGFSVDFAHAPVQHLAFLDQISQSACHIFHRSVLVKAMLVEERNGFQTQRFKDSSQ